MFVPVTLNCKYSSWSSVLSVRLSWRGWGGAGVGGSWVQCLIHFFNPIDTEIHTHCALAGNVILEWRL